MSVELFNIGSLYRGEIVKRPSSECKTPYVADVLKDNELFMAHTASLGCGGLADKDKIVYMIKIENKKNKCPYKIILSEQNEKGSNYLIGMDPKLAERIVDTCLSRNLLKRLSNIRSYEREKTYLNSRFDFAGIDENGEEFILEVKNVPLADYVDCSAKEKSKMNINVTDINDKISYFPDGYRKNRNDPVSVRALKHINELKDIHMEKKIRTILCFVIQRTDISSFQPSKIDPIYRSAVQSAVANGVELMTLVCNWDYNGSVYFVTEDLPINLF